MPPLTRSRARMLERARLLARPRRVHGPVAGQRHNPETHGIREAGLRGEWEEVQLGPGRRPTELYGYRLRWERGAYSAIRFVHVRVGAETRDEQGRQIRVVREIRPWICWRRVGERGHWHGMLAAYETEVVSEPDALAAPETDKEDDDEDSSSDGGSEDSNDNGIVFPCRWCEEFCGGECDLAYRCRRIQTIQDEHGRWPLRNGDEWQCRYCGDYCNSRCAFRRARPTREDEEQEYADEEEDYFLMMWSNLTR